MKRFNKYILATGLIAGFLMPAAYAGPGDFEYRYADRGQYEADREYIKRQQELERERRKFLHEMERESRKHQSEMARERRKHQREMQRERRKASREFEREFNRGYEEIVWRNQDYEYQRRHRHAERDELSVILDILYRI